MPPSGCCQKGFGRSRTSIAVVHPVWTPPDAPERYHCWWYWKPLWSLGRSTGMPSVAYSILLMQTMKLCCWIYLCHGEGLSWMPELRVPQQSLGLGPCLALCLPPPLCLLWSFPFLGPGSCASQSPSHFVLVCSIFLHSIPPFSACPPPTMSSFYSLYRSWSGWGMHFATLVAFRVYFLGEPDAATVWMLLVDRLGSKMPPA